MLLGEGDAFVVDHGGVLDRGHARADRVLDAFGGVSMRFDAQSKMAGLVDRGLQFLQRELLRVRIAAVGEHRAAGENLDVIDSIMRELANDLAHFPRAVGFAVVHVPRQRDVGSEAGIGAGAAGNCDVSAGDVHAWTDDIAAIDRIAQSNISESAVGAYIAHRGES